MGGSRGTWPADLPYIDDSDAVQLPGGLQRPWRLAYRAEVQFADLDKFNHVSNTVAVRWMQEGRYRFRAGYLQPLLDPKEPIGQVVRTASVAYEKPVFLGDIIEVYMAVAAVGASSFTYVYNIWSTAQQAWVLRGKTVMVRFNHETQTKGTVGPTLRRALEAGMAAKASL